MPVPRQQWDMSSIHSAGARLYALALVYLGPGLLIFLVGYAVEIRSVMIAGLIVLAPGVLLMPMGYVGVASDYWTEGLRCDLVLAAVGRNIPSYLMLWVVLLVVQLLLAPVSFGIVLAVGVVMAAIDQGLGQANLLSLVAWVPVYIIGQGLLISLAYVPARVMGLYARYYRHSLPFRFGGA